MAELTVLVRRSIERLLLDGVTVERVCSGLVLSWGLVLVLLRRGVVKQVA